MSALVERFSVEGLLVRHQRWQHSGRVHVLQDGRAEVAWLGTSVADELTTTLAAELEFDLSEG